MTVASERSGMLVRDPAGEPLTVVAIGASAGGLKALQAFFEGVPEDSGMAYVVIMHLDPDRESRIAQILQDRSPIPVAQLAGSTRVQANQVYVIPPGHDLTVRGRTIRLVRRGNEPVHSPIDLFFRALAEAFGADAVGVVLSGTGADGSAGLRHIKEHGGIAVAQSPGEADYDGMPVSAVATGQVDLVIPAGTIAGELVRLRRRVWPAVEGEASAQLEAELAPVLSALQLQTGHDFSLYKRSTLLRRLERRLRFNRVPGLAEYLPVLRTSETESAALVRDLLISVSGFFRDARAFQALGEAIPALFEGRGPGDSVRVWVAGCATGEEAYSVGMLLNEHAATLEVRPQLQIFATDIDAKGYAWGREGFYPASAVGGISAERLRTFFTQEAGGYRVVKGLREQVLFAVHNVLHDPPFSRLDLVTCRNLLIYLQSEAQDQVMETFHYALRPAGLLMLGASESAGANGLFTPVAAAQRLYRRDARPARSVPRVSSADPRTMVPAAFTVDDAGVPPFSYGALHLRMVEEYAPPSLVVDERLRIVHLSGRAGAYLQLGEGKPTHNLIDLARGELRLELRTALRQAFEHGHASTRRIASGGEGGGPLSVEVRLIQGESAGRFALVLFQELPGEPPLPEPEPDQRRAAARLEEELMQTRELLETTSAARDRTVEALQSANEELQSINEEQKSATEELETSREEIQSINEELTTINQEHQNTIEEQKRTNADLQNLIASTEVGTIFLDRELRIRRFTPAAASLFNFLPADEGRPLAHITHRLSYPSVLDDVRRVITTLERLEREVAGEAGEWFVVRINPYRGVDGGGEGAVLTFFDITAQKRVEEELREAKLVAESANLAKGIFLATISHEFRTPLTGMMGYADILGLDEALSAEQQVKVDRINACGRHLAAMIDEILTFAKLDEGQESVRLELVDAREIALQARVLVEPMADARELSFQLEVPDARVELETDIGKLRQVLINLCGNAVKYTERGGIRLAVRGELERVVFEVHDSGIGIAAEDRERVFERFWQVGGGPNRSVGGIGIGLAAAREHARLLGGDVEVESELGQGSTFRVWLPRLYAGAPPVPAEIGPAPSGQWSAPIERSDA